MKWALLDKNRALKVIGQQADRVNTHWMVSLKNYNTNTNIRYAGFLYSILYPCIIKEISLFRILIFHAVVLYYTEICFHCRSTCIWDDGNCPRLVTIFISGAHRHYTLYKRKWVRAAEARPEGLPRWRKWPALCRGGDSWGQRKWEIWICLPLLFKNSTVCCCV